GAPRPPLGGGPPDGGDDPVGGGEADRAGEEAELGHDERDAAAPQPPLPGDHGLVAPAALTGGGQFPPVGGGRSRLPRGRGVPGDPALLVQHAAQQFARTDSLAHPTIMAVMAAHGPHGGTLVGPPAEGKRRCPTRSTSCPPANSPAASAPASCRRGRSCGPISTRSSGRTRRSTRWSR